MGTRATVILEACGEYDPERIRRIVRGGLEHLDLAPHGRTLVKPNCVASGKHFPHAFTRPEFLEGVLLALKDRTNAPLDDFAVGERCGITVPTRYAFKEAGYYPMLQRVGARPVHFDEVSQVEIPLDHEARLRDSLFTPAPVAAADFFVNCPKFKAHPWTTVTFSLKNYIGIQDDRHRLIDHDHKLNEKIADLQYIAQPQFIAIDAITAGEGRMLTPIPFDMGMVLMGDNQVAFDAVCCHIIGVDPRSVPHIRLAHERGFGPIDLEEIDIVGSVSLNDAKARAAGFRVGLIPVDEYFKGSSIRAYGGTPPKPSNTDYCWGGCPGALEEAIEILRQFDTGTDDKIPPTHIVFGAWDKPLDVNPGEKVIFMGDCATYRGPVAGRDVVIENVYEDRSTKKPLDAKDVDIFGKMIGTTLAWQSMRSKDVLEIRGCPVSVAEQVLLLVKLGKLKNPYMDPLVALRFTNAYLGKRARNAMNRLLGIPYNRPGAALRGAAKPRLQLPVSTN